VPSERELRSLTPDAIVSLYEIDLTPIGVAQAFRFVDSVLGGAVRYRDIDYIPWPIEVEGMVLSSEGPLPEPTVKIFNYQNTIIELLDFYDPRGAKFSHRTIFRRHLDDGSDPDPTQEFAPEEYTIHAYDLADTCTLILVTSLAELNQDFPRDTIAAVRDAR
jgi:lambda family phage minor tail protein L